MLAFTLWEPDSSLTISREFPPCGFRYSCSASDNAGDHLTTQRSKSETEARFEQGIVSFSGGEVEDPSLSATSPGSTVARMERDFQRCASSWNSDSNGIAA